jgi:hypothetical protein
LAAQPSSPSAIREIALATGGLPVHVDIGGALVLAADGTILTYDSESKTAVAAEYPWTMRALVKAAKKFPELSELAPSRPASAHDCTVCAGSGIVEGVGGCGKCHGNGWIDD